MFYQESPSQKMTSPRYSTDVRSLFGDGRCRFHFFAFFDLIFYLCIVCSSQGAHIERTSRDHGYDSPQPSSNVRPVI